MARTPRLAIVMLLALVAACSEPAEGEDAGSPTDAAAVDSTLASDVPFLYDLYYPRPDTGPGCGDVPSGGECTDEGVLRWCEDGQVHEADCGALGLTCGEKPSLGGTWCPAGPGQSCQDWPCLEGLTCSGFRICVGVLDGGFEDAGEAGFEDAGEAGPEDAPTDDG